MRRLLFCVVLFLVSACGGDNSSAPPIPAPVPMVCCSGTLTWQPNIETDLAGYHVYRSTDANIPNPPGMEFIGEILCGPNDSSCATFVDTTGIEGTTYYYVVTAFDNAAPANESDVSNEVSKQY